MFTNSVSNNQTMVRFRQRAAVAFEAVLFVLALCFYVIQDLDRRRAYEAVRWALALALATLYLGWWFSFLYRTPGG